MTHIDTTKFTQAKSLWNDDPLSVFAKWSSGLSSESSMKQAWKGEREWVRSLRLVYCPDTQVFPLSFLRRKCWYHGENLGCTSSSLELLKRSDKLQQVQWVPQLVRTPTAPVWIPPPEWRASGKFWLIHEVWCSLSGFSCWPLHIRSDSWFRDLVEIRRNFPQIQGFGYIMEASGIRLKTVSVY